MCFDIIQQFILVFRKTKNLGLIRISTFQRETPNRQVSVAGEVLELWQQNLANALWVWQQNLAKIKIDIGG